MEELLYGNQTIVCPACGTKMRVRYQHRAGSAAMPDHDFICVNPNCEKEFFEGLLGPFVDGPFPMPGE